MMAAATLITLLLSVLFLTVLGGGLFPSTVGIVAVITGAMSCLVIAMSARRNATSSRGPLPGLEIILSLLLLFILLTALPLPPVLDPLAGSLRHEQNQAVVTAIHEASRHGTPPLMEDPWFCLSRNRAGTLRFFLLLAAAISAGMLTSSLQGPWRIGYLSFLALTGAVVGTMGYLSQWVIPQGDTIWWFIPIPHAPTSSVGCFLNRNHFGGFVAMLCPIAIALTSYALFKRRWISGIFYLALTGVMAATVFMSLSRGAMIGLCAGLAVTTLIIAFRQSIRRGLLLLVLMGVGCGALVAISPAVRERLSGIQNPTQLDSAKSRLNEWRESLRVWPYYPVIGAGANALRMVYPQYRQTSVSARMTHAENEYIQLITECGLIGVTLAGTLLWAMYRRIRQANEPLPPVIITAVSGAMTVIAIHCLFDFPAHLPLYALVLGSLAGLLLTQPPATTRSTRWLALSPGMVAVIGTALIALFHPTDVRNMDDQQYLYKAKYRELNRALIWAPTSPAWLFLGRAMLREGAIVGNGGLCAEGENFISRAAALDPQNYGLWYEVGKTRLALKDTDRANEAFRRAHALRSWITPPPNPRKTLP
ncbi:MAG: O-antigen ligase family protein [bacterium]